jgi:hypothetical protein
MSRRPAWKNSLLSEDSDREQLGGERAYGALIDRRTLKEV